MRLRRENLIRQPILGSGPKMDAGAIETVTRTEVQNFCPQINVAAVQLKILFNSNLF